MLVNGVDHISFAVRDLDRAKAFYAGILGLREIDRPDFGIGGAWFDAGGAQVHLIELPESVDVGAPPPGLSPLANHQAFAVADYAKTLEALERSGVEVMQTSPESGQLFVRDPDGNVLEFIVEGIRR